jgi:hypothetical protein
MIHLSVVRNIVYDQRGQVLPWAAFMILTMLGMGGMVLDVGRAYVARTNLQNAANSAALAAAGVVYNTSSTDDANSVANTYSASSTDSNSGIGVASVSTSVTPKCLNMLMPSGSTCGTSSTNNAVQVVETTTIKTFFMPIVFGPKTLTVSATATASMNSMSQPWNVAVIIDSTGSMASTDSDCGGVTEFQCALSGVQTLLSTVNPCPPGETTCSSDARFNVSLFTFPNILTSYNGTTVNSISDEINCGGSPASWTSYSSQPVAAPYTLPVPGATLSGTPNSTYMTYTETSTGHPWTATYQVTPFESDYYSASSSSGLNSSANLVKAVGYGTTSGCLTYTFGIWGTGSGSGFGNTYFAGSIYEAQAALAAESTANGGKNALIFLSDGQANASYYSKNSSAYGGSNSTNQYADAYEFPSGPSGSEVGPHVSNDPTPSYYTPATTSTTNGYYSLTGTGTYPDWKDQCQQGIAAAQWVANQGTRVYSVAYGSEDSGCNSGWSVGATDTTLVATGKNATFTLSQLTPCVTMENLASSMSYFYSDYNQSGSGSTCQDASHTVSSMNDIFKAIAATFTMPRLLPNNAS